MPTGERNQEKSGSDDDFAVSHADDLIGELSEALLTVGVSHECYHDCVMVTIPGSVLEVKFWSDGSDSVQMIPGDFHTHLQILALETGLSGAVAFAVFAKKVLSGEFPLIEETTLGGGVRQTIERSLEEYLRYRPKGTTYRVLNGTSSVSQARRLD